MGRVEESRGEVRRERPGGEGWDQQSEKGEEGKRGLANVRRIDAANHDRFLNLEQREEREERERKERQETNPLLNETAESPKRRRRQRVFQGEKEAGTREEHYGHREKRRLPEVSAFSKKRCLCTNSLCTFTLFVETLT